MSARYQAGETLQLIGDRYGLTRERVRQILHRMGVARRPKGRPVHAPDLSTAQLPHDGLPAHESQGKDPAGHENDLSRVRRGGADG